MYVSSYINCVFCNSMILPGVASKLVENTHGDVESNTAFTIVCERYALSCKLYSCKENFIINVIEGLLQYTSNSDSTAISFTSSIEWNNRNVVNIRVTKVLVCEGVVCLIDIHTVSTEVVCCTVLICHIVYEDRVPDIRVDISHIQREWRSPRHSH